MRLAAGRQDLVPAGNRLSTLRYARRLVDAGCARRERTPLTLRRSHPGATTISGSLLHMSSRTTVKAAARDRTAAMRAAQVRTERRRRAVIAGVSVLAVVAVFAALVIAKAAGVGSGGSTDTASNGSNGPSAAPAALVAKVTSVPQSV